PQLDRADRRALSEQRNAQRRAMAKPPRIGAAFGELRRLSLEVGHVNSALFKHRAFDDGATPARSHQTYVYGNCAMMGHDSQSVPLTFEEGGAVSATEACRTLDHVVQHGLKVARRRADDPQNLRRRRLLFLRLNQLAVARLEFPQRLGLTLRGLGHALLQIADLGVVLGRLTGPKGLGFPGLRGLWTPAHWPPLASYESAGDTLGEPVSQGKRTHRLNVGST